MFSSICSPQTWPFTLCVSLVFLLSTLYFVLHQFPYIPQSCEKVGGFLILKHNTTLMFIHFQHCFFSRCFVYLFTSSDYILVFWFIKCFIKNAPGCCQNASCSTGGACVRWGGWGWCLQQTEGLFAWSTHRLPLVPILNLSVLLLCLSDSKALKYEQNILKRHNMLSWWQKLHQKINRP